MPVARTEMSAQAPRPAVAIKPDTSSALTMIIVVVSLDTLRISYASDLPPYIIQAAGEGCYRDANDVPECGTKPSSISTMSTSTPPP
jgi:hypothetical protein